MSVRVIFSQPAIKALGSDPMMRAPVSTAVREVVNRAQASSPFLTGHYKRSLRAGDPVADGRSVVASVGSVGEPGSVAIEFGSVNNPAYAPITKGVRATGLRLEGRT